MSYSLASFVARLTGDNTGFARTVEESKKLLDGLSEAASRAGSGGASSLVAARREASAVIDQLRQVGDSVGQVPGLEALRANLRQSAAEAQQLQRSFADALAPTLTPARKVDKPADAPPPPQGSVDPDAVRRSDALAEQTAGLAALRTQVDDLAAAGSKLDLAIARDSVDALAGKFREIADAIAGGPVSGGKQFQDQLREAEEEASRLQTILAQLAIGGASGTGIAAATEGLKAAADGADAAINPFAAFGEWVKDVREQLAGMNRPAAEAAEATKAVADAVQSAAQESVGTAGAPALAASLEKAQETTAALGQQLGSLADTDLAPLLKIGSLTETIAAVGAATKSFTDTAADLTSVQERFQSLRGELDENAQRLRAFAADLAGVYALAKTDAKFSPDVPTIGPDPNAAQRADALAGQATQIAGLRNQVDALAAAGSQLDFSVAREAAAALAGKFQEIADAIANGPVSGGKQLQDQLRDAEEETLKLQSALAQLVIGGAGGIGVAAATEGLKAAADGAEAAAVPFASFDEWIRGVREQLAGMNRPAAEAAEAAKTVADAVQSAAQQSVGDAGTPALAASLEQAQEATKTLGQQLAAVTDTDLAPLLKIENLVEIVTGVSEATKKLTDAADDLEAIQGRFQSLGTDIDDNSNKLRSFADELANLNALSKSDAARVTLETPKSGPDPDAAQRADALADQAVGLAALRSQMDDLAAAGSQLDFSVARESVDELSGKLLDIAEAIAAGPVSGGKQFQDELRLAEAEAVKLQEALAQLSLGGEGGTGIGTATEGLKAAAEGAEAAASPFAAFGDWVKNLREQLAELGRPSEDARDAAKGVGDAVQSAAQASVGDAGITPLMESLEQAQEATKALGQQLAAMANTDLSALLQVGNLTETITTAGEATKSFADATTDLAAVQDRFAVIGLEIDAGIQKLRAFAAELASLSTAPKADATAVQHDASKSGPDPDAAKGAAAILDQAAAMAALRDRMDELAASGSKFDFSVAREAADTLSAKLHEIADAITNGLVSGGKQFQDQLHEVEESALRLQATLAQTTLGGDQGIGQAAEAMKSVADEAEASASPFESFSDWVGDLGEKLTGLERPADEAKNAAKGVGEAVRETAKEEVGTAGAPSLTASLGKANEAAKTLGQQLLSLAEIDLSTLLKLGSLVGIATVVGAATKKFMDAAEDIKLIQDRFQMLGMEFDDNSKKLRAFSTELAGMYAMSKSDIKGIALEALTKGAKPERYQEMTQSAIGLGFALGINNQRAMFFVSQLEAGNYMMLRRNPIFREMIEQGASRLQIEAKVNELIARGLVVAKDQVNDYSGKIQLLKNKFSDLWYAVSQAVGPAVVPLFTKLVDVVGGLTEKLTNLINTNREGVTKFIQMGVAALAAGSAMFLLRGRLGLVGSALGMLVPSLGGGGGIGGLLQAMAGGAAAALRPFAAMESVVKTGIMAIPAALSAVVGAIPAAIGTVANFIDNWPQKLGIFGKSVGRGLVGPLMAVLRTVLFLANPLNGLAAIVATVGAAAGGAAVGLRLLTFAFRGLLAATGIGLLVGIVGALLGMADTFGSTESAAGSFGEVLKGIWAEVLAAITPVWEWMQTEGLIIFKALVASGRQVIEGLKEIWPVIVEAWGDAVKWFQSIFGDALNWITETTGVNIMDISELWKNFTAELAVLGLRMRQVGLAVIIGLSAIPAVISWIGDAFQAIADWLGTNWVSAIIGVAEIFGQAWKLQLTSIKDLAVGVFDYIFSAGQKGFDFTDTQAQFDKLRAKLSESVTGLTIPGLDVSNVAPELRAQLDGLTKEIQDKKSAARTAQDADRTNRQNRGTGKTTGEPSNAETGVKIGGRDKAHFTDPLAFWKKLQEAAAGQRAEYIQQQQLSTQQEMARILGLLYQGQQNQPRTQIGPTALIPR